jgi:hypothetical protein
MTRFVTTALAAGLLTAGPALAGTAGYTATFDATWTEQTHATDYPPDPHFSGLVGGTHDASVVFWEPGRLASLGIKRMAEWGSQADLLAEVQAAIDAGAAGQTIADAPLWTVPGATSVDFTVSDEHPLVTLTAMIAPSPDWFVGVRGLDLRDGQGGWVEEVVVDLFAYDAGTDSGPGYTSGDQPTVPPEPVFAIAGYPFSPGVPIGTLTVTRNFVAGVPAAPAFAARAYPNPFNPRTTIAWELPRAGELAIRIYDVRGRHVVELRRGPAPAGPGTAAWEGRDRSGRRVRAGLYFARLESDFGTRVVKMTLVK